MIVSGLLLSVPCFFLNLKSYKKSHLFIFFILLVISITEVYGKHLGLQGIRNHWVYNIGFVYVETILILFYLSILINDKLQTRILRYMALAFGAWGIITSLFISPITQFHNYNYTFAGILIILGCLTFFYNLITNETYMDQQLWKVPDFWVVSLILLFYSASLLFFSIFYYVITLEQSSHRFLSFVIKIIGGTMYLSFGLLYYLALLKKESSSDVPADFKYSKKLSV